MQQLRAVKDAFASAVSSVSAIRPFPFAYNQRIPNLPKSPPLIPSTATSHVLMIRPQFFYLNNEAQKTNAFIFSSQPDSSTIQQKALAEHTCLVETLQNHSIPVHVFDNTNTKAVDALFCNNWISMHHPPELERTTMILYPMMLENRRIEVRKDICKYIADHYQSAKLQVIDLRLPNNPHFLEGTGSMVIDRVNRTIYATISERTHLMMLRTLSDIIGHKIVFFHTHYMRRPVYHTNVMMAIGHSWIVICKDVVASGCQASLFKHLDGTGKTIIPISTAQMESFCGNIIELSNAAGKRYTVMSDKARAAFTPEQLDIFKQHGDILSVPFDTIEKYGGGGVRCCIAEI